MLRLNFIKKFRKNFIVKYEIINDKIIDVRLVTEKLRFPVSIEFFKPYILITAKVGIERRKEIFAESYLLNFKNLAAVMVIPDLLTPGINESI